MERDKWATIANGERLHARLWEKGYVNGLSLYIFCYL